MWGGSDTHYTKQRVRKFLSLPVREAYSPLNRIAVSPVQTKGQALSKGSREERPKTGGQYKYLSIVCLCLRKALLIKLSLRAGCSIGASHSTFTYPTLYIVLLHILLSTMYWYLPSDLLPNPTSRIFCYGLPHGCNHLGSDELLGRAALYTEKGFRSTKPKKALQAIPGVATSRHS